MAPRRHSAPRCRRFAAALSADKMRLLLDYTAQQHPESAHGHATPNTWRRLSSFAGKPASGAVLTASLIRSGWTGWMTFFWR